MKLELTGTLVAMEASERGSAYFVLNVKYSATRNNCTSLLYRLFDNKSIYIQPERISSIDSFLYFMQNKLANKLYKLTKEK